jgi:hypothetical protein
MEKRKDDMTNHAARGAEGARGQRDAELCADCAGAAVRLCHAAPDHTDGALACAARRQEQKKKEEKRKEKKRKEGRGKEEKTL